MTPDSQIPTTELLPVLELLDEIVWQLHPDTFETAYVNGVVEEITGYRPEEFLLRPGLRREIVHPEDRPRLDAAAALPPSSRITPEIHYRILRPDGHVRWLRERRRLVAAGAGTAVVCVSRDVTPNHSVLEEIERVRDAAAEQEVLHLVEMARKDSALQQALLEHRRAERIRSVLARTSERLNNTATPRETALAILEAADELFGWDAAFLDVYNPERDRFYALLRYDVVNGKRLELAPPSGGEPLTPLRRRLFENGPILLLRDGSVPPPDESELVSFGEGSRRSAALMFVPVLKGARRAGVLSIQSYHSGHYDQRDLEVLQILANTCCTALERTFAEARAHTSEQLLRQRGELPVVQWTTDQALRITWAAGLPPPALNSPPCSQWDGRPVAEILPFASLDEAHRQALEGKSTSVTLPGPEGNCGVRIDPLRELSGAVTGCMGMAVVDKQPPP